MNYPPKDVQLEEQADYGTLNAFYENWNATSDKLINFASRPCITADFGHEKTQKQQN